MDIQWVPCRKTNESKRRYNLEIKQEKFAGIVLRGRYLSAVALGGGMKGGGKRIYFAGSEWPNEPSSLKFVFVDA